MGLQIEIATSDEWHVLKGETKFGPYTYSEVIKMMQGKTLFNFDYVWSPHLENWTAIGELTEFSVDRLNRLAEKNTQNTEAFNQRSSERCMVSIPVYCHDNSKMWPGLCENLSAGGALILMENPLLLPGHIIDLHFRGLKEGEKSFNCSAEILAKRLTKQRIQHDTGLHYAVKFIQMMAVGESQIKNWMNNKKV